jgi:peptidoglycan/LPS O-acetylase OafA/YrhL
MAILSTLNVLPKSTRIPSLDGWRGIAILLVLVDHARIALRIDTKPGIYTGQHGVALFFVLSGFLITNRLLAEIEGTGTLSLLDFYRRRAFRLLPCAWAYLVAILLLTVKSNPKPYTDAELVSSLLFFRNFLDPMGTHPLTGHFWSLSIEEQFYLVWPFVLMTFRVTSARWIAAIGAVAVAGYRYMHWSSLSQLPLQSTFGTQLHADALLVGCASALFLPNLRPYLKTWMALPSAVGLLWCMGRYPGLIPLHESVLMALLILTTSFSPLTARLLSLKPLVFLGAVSYSLYVWQQVFMQLIRSSPELFSVYSIAFVVTALASYFLIEKPFISLGRRGAPRLSSKSAHPTPNPSRYYDCAK